MIYSAKRFEFKYNFESMVLMSILLAESKVTCFICDSNHDHAMHDVALVWVNI